MNLERFAIIESTLREGEQFVSASFSQAQKIRLAHLLDDFGVEFLELTSPLASPQSRADCERIASLGLRARTLTHIRCNLDDARVAVDTGVDGVDVVIGTSPYLCRSGHGKGIEEIIDAAQQVVTYLLTTGVQVRFSTEDSLRSDWNDLLRVYRAVDELGVHRVGIADTVGVGTPRQIYHLVGMLRPRVRADIEFHGHNDCGCAIANSLAALEAGATHVDTSVLGIGERNGITPLGGLVARLYAIDPALVAKYQLPLLPELDRLIAEWVGVEVPFNNYITGSSAFAHKAGIHAKAVLNEPATYEILRPEDFGLTRTLPLGHRLTGWNALRHRAEQLGLRLPESELRQLTWQVKTLADSRTLSTEEVDTMLIQWSDNAATLGVEG